MAQLIITRKSEFINSLTDFSIYLNEEKIGTISNGESEEFIIPEGTNSLKVKNDWYGSKVLKINAGNEQTISVSISSLWPGHIFKFFISFIVVVQILFREFIRNHYLLKYTFLILSIITVIAVVYYLTFGRNKYIELVKTPASTE